MQNACMCFRVYFKGPQLKKKKTETKLLSRNIHTTNYTAKLFATSEKLLKIQRDKHENTQSKRHRNAIRKYWWKIWPSIHKHT